MPTVDQIVQVTITKQSSAVDTASFNVPLLAVYHNHYADRVRQYSATTMLAQMVTEGFLTTDPGYLLAQAVLSQNPRVRDIKIGRRDSDWSQIVRLTPSAVVNLGVYSVEINGVLCTFTADATATLAEICTGLAAAINASSVNTLVTADGTSGTHVAVTSDAAVATLVSYTTPLLLLVTDESVDGGIAADLNTIRLADSKWYGLLLDNPGTAENMLAAAYAETQKIIFGISSADSSATDPADTTGILSDLEALGYDRTYFLYHPDARSFAAAAWMGDQFPYDPGSTTWAYKTLGGVAVTTLLTSEDAAVLAKNGNTYTSVGGRSITFEGKMVSGEFIDITIFIDWLEARIKERVFALIASSPKLPYSDDSTARLAGEVRAVLQAGIDVGGLLADPAPTVTYPKVRDVSPIDRAARHFPDMRFTAQLAGAIHTISIDGLLQI